MLTEEKQKFEVAKAQTERSTTKARDGWKARILRIQLEMSDALQLRTAAEDKLALLAPHLENVEAAEFSRRMELLVETGTQVAKMKEREISCFEKSVALLD